MFNIMSFEGHSNSNKSSKLHPDPLFHLKCPCSLCFNQLFRQMTVAILLQYWGKGHLWIKLWGKSGNQREEFDFVSQKKSLNMVCSCCYAFWHELSSLEHVCSHELPLLIKLFVILSSAQIRGQTELHLVHLLASSGNTQAPATH